MAQELRFKQAVRVTLMWVIQDLTLRNTNLGDFWIFHSQPEETTRNQILPPGSVEVQRCSRNGGDWKREKSEAFWEGRGGAVLWAECERTIATLSNTAKGSDMSGDNDSGNKKVTNPRWSLEYHRDSGENREAFLHHLLRKRHCAGC